MHKNEKKIQQLRHQIKSMEMQINYAKEELHKQLIDCDHKHQDGSSAIEGLMFCNSCSLCGWNDL